MLENKYLSFLKYASFIGLSFPKYEVERLIECSHIELSNLIDKSDEICLTTSDKKNAHFTHDLIRMIFAFRAKKDKAIYSSKMAVCVKELYPSEYYQRMEYELNSGNDRNFMHHRDIQYPRMEIFVNNYLLALLFSNKISTEKMFRNI